MFTDRADAGRRLARALEDLPDRDVVVLGLPRGGVPVAFEVARTLGAPLDVIVVRKLGVPFQPELAMGAVGEGGVLILNESIVRMTRISADEIAAAQRREEAEVADRAGRFRAGRPRVGPAGRTAVIVDDGIATGATARAACQVARAQGAARVVLAVPVAPTETVEAMRGVADQVVCLHVSDYFSSVGEWYDDFGQTTDAEVVALLRRAAGRPRGRGEDVLIDGGYVELSGRLTVPQDAAGVVAFVHGSGSGRHSPRNRYVAEALNRAGLGTLLFDLLSAEEELDRANVFDVGMLAARLSAATRWLRARPEVGDAGVGYFGASTGAAAALWAAAEPDAEIAAVVSRGGRPDLAGRRLAAVRAPTLLIVGGDDEPVLTLNREAQQRLRCESRLSVVPGATHLFEEPGALETVAELARDWFLTHLRQRSRPALSGS